MPPKKVATNCNEILSHHGKPRVKTIRGFFSFEILSRLSFPLHRSVITVYYSKLVMQITKFKTTHAKKGTPGMRWFVIGLTVAVAATLWGCSTKEETTMPAPADQYVSKVIECLTHTESILPDMQKAADAAAAKWANGGHLYVTDDETINRTGKEEVKAIPGGGYNYPMSED
jgi:hypothetical protein